MHGFSRAAMIVIAALAFGPTIVHAQRAPYESRPFVVLISVDGLKPEYVLKADSLGLKIPTLRRFFARGAYATGVTGVLPTVTYPSHVTLLTGVAPATHGVYANTTFDPLNTNFGGWRWYADDIKVPTLWDAAADSHLVTASVHWPVSVRARVTYNVPQYWRSGNEDDRKLLRALSAPIGLLDSLERELGPYADGIDESIDGDENRGRFAVRLLEWKRPDFMTAYFTALDHEQHASGPFSPEARATLERIDAILGALVAAANRVSAGRAVVAVVSDHGFTRTVHDVNLAIPFRDAGLVTFAAGLDDKLTGWDATIWAAGASGAVVLRDRSDANARAKVQAVLERLLADSASGVDRVLDSTSLARGGGFPTADFLIALKPGYKLGGRISGPLVVDVPVSGVHGYLPDFPEMRASFFIMGPGIASHRSLGLIEMRDIAPTLAGILGVSLPRAEGQDLFRRERHVP